MKNSKRRRRGTPKLVARISRPATGEVSDALTSRNIRCGLVSLAGWLVALMLGVLDLPAKINSFFSEKDVALSNLSPRFDKETYIGRWTNDESLRPFTNMIGDGDRVDDHGELQLFLSESEKGRIEGEIVCSTIFPYTRVFISGQLAMAGGFDGFIWDIVGNERKVLAYFRLEPDGGEKLRFTSDANFAHIIPTETILWRTSEEMSGGAFNPDYLNTVKDILEKNTGSK